MTLSLSSACQLSGEECGVKGKHVRYMQNLRRNYTAECALGVFILFWGIVALSRHARQNVFLKLFDLSKESSWEKDRRSPLERRDTQWKVIGRAICHSTKTSKWSSYVCYWWFSHLAAPAAQFSQTMQVVTTVCELPMASGYAPWLLPKVKYHSVHAVHANIYGIISHSRISMKN